jgi:hypothetical protein
VNAVLCPRVRATPRAGRLLTAVTRRVGERQRGMNATKLTAIATTATIALGAALPATGAAKATGPGKHTVNQEAYVTTQAGKNFSGTMFKGQTFKVKRLSKSGKYAYGFAYGQVNRHVWIEAAALDRKAS